ncbi:ATP-grasp domain-containing protein [Bradyrhizobium lablabi]|uniref:ATP-grasp domain-containing protein n=1 Tax=Bradyrhizobium lablabi TaxID=722472 RepID=UPI001BA568D7|nr:ATP-grasp domain-containing protein [Bradyrhizobium lablabi]MBR1123565.1 ATP-grasp domain-containing protein [Bradyrhizobium lablabi]
MIDPAQQLRILIPEGSSTSGREAVTILGLAGHHVEVCDPSPWCLARYSRFVRKFHRCPGLRTDPAGFLAFVEGLIASGRFDVLLPTHEQGFLFARVQERLAGKIAFALPSFESYRMAHSKAGFSRLLDRLDLPQPPTRILKSQSEPRGATRFPAVVKTSVGTASRGIRFVHNESELASALHELEAGGGFADEVLVQDMIAGTTEKAQSVFCRGRLLGFHAFRQVAPGIGGGEAIKESVRRPVVRGDLEKLGAELGWHGGLSVDYIMPDDGTAPLLIDCNPRLVEPFNAFVSGVDLVTLLLRVSLGEEPEALPEGRERVLTHLSMQALLGFASRGGSRRAVAREFGRLLDHSGPYAGSVEELTPLSHDWYSAVPLGTTFALMLASPAAATKLARGGFGAHLLDLKSIREIESWDP